MIAGLRKGNTKSQRDINEGKWKETSVVGGESEKPWERDGET